MGRSCAAGLRLVAASLACLLLAACARQDPPAAADTAAAPGTYVGTTACANCHAAELQSWQGSHHDLAMQVASDATVLGNFNDASFTKDGVTSTFFRRDGSFRVRTDGPDGKLAEFPVSHTFGVAPLQQYLVPFPDGRFQALPIAWDTRPQAAGGQRWFHLYPKEKIGHQDPLHWTKPAQNWNYMCAECHSTDLQKNYDATTDTFKTGWSDLNVGCEACHGPGSRHVAWATADPRPDDPERGLLVRQPGQPAGNWSFTPGDPIANRSAPPPRFRTEVETCGRCHSRRGQVWPEVAPGQPLADTHRVALLDEDLYHADGQIKDEVFEYGSFLQSRMFAAGVTCSDCHDPHSARLRAEGNALCARCHAPDAFDTPKHTFHPANTPGAQCVSCHMGQQLYMVVDGRRDHSFRVPRPDLSATTGAPNACNDCHTGKSPQWAAMEIAQRFGTGRRSTPHYGVAIAAGRAGTPDARDLLRGVLADPAAPAIARATALTLLPVSPDSPELRSALKDPDPLLRRAAAESLQGLEPGARMDLGVPLLTDPVRTVRLAATGSLLGVPREQVLMEERATFDAATAEYRAAQQLNADRADGQLNLGLLEVNLGNIAAGEAAYRKALKLQPEFLPAYVNLADLLAGTGREAEAEQLLKAAVTLEPDNGSVHHALGLSLVRQQRLPEAVAELQKAAAAEPDNARFAYVYAVALKETGQTDAAVAVLRRAKARHPDDGNIRVALEEYSGGGPGPAAPGQADKTGERP